MPFNDIHAFQNTLLGRLFFLALSFASGVVLSFTMAPYEFWPLLFLGFSVFYVCLASSKTTAFAALNGWMFGFGYFLFSLSWIGNALLVEGNDYRWAWPLAVIALPFALAFFTAIASALIRQLSDLKSIFGYLSFVALLSLFEFLRGHLFTGFPWNLYGYAWGGQDEILQTLSLQNVYVLTMLTIFWSAIFGFWAVSKDKTHAARLTLIVALSFGLSFGYGWWRLKNYTELPHYDNVLVHIIQPNIPQAEKWERDKIGLNFQKHINLHDTDDNHPENVNHLYIWPETSLHPAYVASPEAEDIIKKRLRTQTNASQASLLAGALIFEPDKNEYTNSLIEYNKDGRSTAQYDKAHLVPFGEYIPFQNWIPLDTITRFNGIQSGDGIKTLTVFETLKYSPLICYEILFPGKVINQNDRPDFIVNITNDAWYGDSAGPHQHLSKARFRALEEGITVIRAANTGISAMINPLGQIIEQKPLFQSGQILSKIPKPIDQNRKIFYTGNMLLYVGFLAWIVFFLYKRSIYRKP